VRYRSFEADCEYEVVPKVGKELKWKIKTYPTNPEWDVWWTDWAVAPEVLMKMEHHQKINHFPGMYTLSRKNLLAKNLMKMRRKNPD
jgi:tubulin polyglutamylase TTLL6/13